MTTIEKRATTGRLEADIEGDTERWVADSVIYQADTNSFVVGGPEEGVMFKGLYFTFPTDISVGEHAINRGTRVGAWFNPGRANSWIADEEGGTVNVLSVSSNDASIKISFNFVAVNPANNQERKKIEGEGEFEGHSLKSDVKYKK